MTKAIRVNQIKLKVDCQDEKPEYYIKNVVMKAIGYYKSYDIEYEIIKKSIDSRKKPDIYYVFSIDIINVFNNSKGYPLVMCRNWEMNRRKLLCELLLIYDSITFT